MIDVGPTRAPQPVDRRVSQRPEATSRPAESSQPTPVETREAPRFDTSKKAPRDKKGSLKFLWVILAIVAVAALLYGGWALLSKDGSVAGEIDGRKRQAVFMASGEIYFGKLEIINDSYMRLSDVFYIQTSSNATDGEDEATTEGGMQLIKLGDEVHGPEDKMVINRDQVKFFENLKDDSRVTELIKSHNSGQ